MEIEAIHHSLAHLLAMAVSKTVLHDKFIVLPYAICRC